MMKVYWVINSDRESEIYVRKPARRKIEFNLDDVFRRFSCGLSRLLDEILPFETLLDCLYTGCRSYEVVDRNCLARVGRAKSRVDVASVTEEDQSLESAAGTKHRLAVAM
jgi:hypothetical protein